MACPAETWIRYSEGSGVTSFLANMKKTCSSAITPPPAVSHPNTDELLQLMPEDNFFRLNTDHIEFEGDDDIQEGEISRNRFCASRKTYLTLADECSGQVYPIMSPAMCQTAARQFDVSYEEHYTEFSAPISAGCFKLDQRIFYNPEPSLGYNPIAAQSESFPNQLEKVCYTVDKINLNPRCIVNLCGDHPNDQCSPGYYCTDDKRCKRRYLRMAEEETAKPLTLCANEDDCPESFQCIRESYRRYTVNARDSHGFSQRPWGNIKTGICNYFRLMLSSNVANYTQEDDDKISCHLAHTRSDDGRHVILHLEALDNSTVVFDSLCQALADPSFLSAIQSDSGVFLLRDGHSRFKDVSVICNNAFLHGQGISGAYPSEVASLEGRSESFNLVFPSYDISESGNSAPGHYFGDWTISQQARARTRLTTLDMCFLKEVQNNSCTMDTQIAELQHKLDEIALNLTAILHDEDGRNATFAYDPLAYSDYMLTLQAYFIWTTDFAETVTVHFRERNHDDLHAIESGDLLKWEHRAHFTYSLQFKYELDQPFVPWSILRRGVCRPKKCYDTRRDIANTFHAFMTTRADPTEVSDEDLVNTVKRVAQHHNIQIESPSSFNGGVAVASNGKNISLAIHEKYLAQGMTSENPDFKFGGATAIKVTTTRERLAFLKNRDTRKIPVFTAHPPIGRLCKTQYQVGCSYLNASAHTITEAARTNSFFTSLVPVAEFLDRHSSVIAHMMYSLADPFSAMQDPLEVPELNSSTSSTSGTMTDMIYIANNVLTGAADDYRKIHLRTLINNHPEAFNRPVDDPRVCEPGQDLWIYSDEYPSSLAMHIDKEGDITHAYSGKWLNCNKEYAKVYKSLKYEPRLRHLVPREPKEFVGLYRAHDQHIITHINGEQIKEDEVDSNKFSAKNVHMCLSAGSTGDSFIGEGGIEGTYQFRGYSKAGGTIFTRDAVNIAMTHMSGTVLLDTARAMTTTESAEIRRVINAFARDNNIMHNRKKWIDQEFRLHFQIMASSLVTTCRPAYGCATETVAHYLLKMCKKAVGTCTVANVLKIEESLISDSEGGTLDTLYTYNGTVRLRMHSSNISTITNSFENLEESERDATDAPGYKEFLLIALYPSTATVQIQWTKRASQQLGHDFEERFRAALSSVIETGTTIQTVDFDLGQDTNVAYNASKLHLYYDPECHQGERGAWFISRTHKNANPRPAEYNWCDPPDQPVRFDFSNQFELPFETAYTFMDMCDGNPGLVQVTFDEAIDHGLRVVGFRGAMMSDGHNLKGDELHMRVREAFASGTKVLKMQSVTMCHTGNQGENSCEHSINDCTYQLECPRVTTELWKNKHNIFWDDNTLSGAVERGGALYVKEQDSVRFVAPNTLSKPSTVLRRPGRCGAPGTVPVNWNINSFLYDDNIRVAKGDTLQIWWTPDHKHSTAITIVEADWVPDDTWADGGYYQCPTSTDDLRVLDTINLRYLAGQHSDSTARGPILHRIPNHPVSGFIPNGYVQGYCYMDLSPSGCPQIIGFSKNQRRAVLAVSVVASQITLVEKNCHTDIAVLCEETLGGDDGFSLDRRELHLNSDDLLSVWIDFNPIPGFPAPSRYYWGVAPGPCPMTSIEFTSLNMTIAAPSSTYPGGPKILFYGYDDGISLPPGQHCMAPITDVEGLYAKTAMKIIVQTRRQRYVDYNLEGCRRILVTAHEPMILGDSVSQEYDRFRGELVPTKSGSISESFQSYYLDLKKSIGTYCYTILPVFSEHDEQEIRSQMKAYQDLHFTINVAPTGLMPRNSRGFRYEVIDEDAHLVTSTGYHRECWRDDQCNGCGGGSVCIRSGEAKSGFCAVAEADQQTAQGKMFGFYGVGEVQAPYMPDTFQKIVGDRPRGVYILPSHFDVTNKVETFTIYAHNLALFERTIRSKKSMTDNECVLRDYDTGRISVRKESGMIRGCTPNCIRHIQHCSSSTVFDNPDFITHSICQWFLVDVSTSSSDTLANWNCSVAIIHMYPLKLKIEGVPSWKYALIASFPNVYNNETQVFSDYEAEAAVRHIVRNAFSLATSHMHLDYTQDSITATSHSFLPGPFSTPMSCFAHYVYENPKCDVACDILAPPHPHVEKWTLRVQGVPGQKHQVSLRCAQTIMDSGVQRSSYKIETYRENFVLESRFHADQDHLMTTEFLETRYSLASSGAGSVTQTRNSRKRGGVKRSVQMTIPSGAVLAKAQSSATASNGLDSFEEVATTDLFQMLMQIDHDNFKVTLVMLHTIQGEISPIRSSYIINSIEARYRPTVNQKKTYKLHVTNPHTTSNIIGPDGVLLSPGDTLQLTKDDVFLFEISNQATELEFQLYEGACPDITNMIEDDMPTYLTARDEFQMFLSSPSKITLDVDLNLVTKLRTRPGDTHCVTALYHYQLIHFTLQLMPEEQVPLAYDLTLFEAHRVSLKHSQAYEDDLIHSTSQQPNQYPRPNGPMSTFHSKDFFMEIAVLPKQQEDVHGLSQRTNAYEHHPHSYAASFRMQSSLFQQQRERTTDVNESPYPEPTHPTTTDEVFGDALVLDGLRGDALGYPLAQCAMQRNATWYEIGSEGNYPSSTFAKPDCRRSCQMTTHCVAYAYRHNDNVDECILQIPNAQGCDDIVNTFSKQTETFEATSISTTEGSSMVALTINGHYRFSEITILVTGFFTVGFNTTTLLWNGLSVDDIYRTHEVVSVERNETHSTTSLVIDVGRNATKTATETGVRVMFTRTILLSPPEFTPGNNVTYTYFWNHGIENAHPMNFMCSRMSMNILNVESLRNKYADYTTTCVHGEL